MSACVACGFEGEFEGPVHTYMSPSAACWARYGEVLAREYSDRDYWRSHRVLTDAYCGQHSVGEDRRARQSLHLHLAGLMLHFEDRAEEQAIIGFLRKAAVGTEFAALEMPEANLGVTIGDVFRAQDAAEHGAAVETYARDVFDAWEVHHPVFRALIERAV